ncbi:MAG: transcriptional repressor [Oscillospiraceae bacterium]|nr:transcriptional repressor [Oscillospiraceae bacterium]
MEGSTKQFRKRNAILECLRGTTLHPSADMVHNMLQAEHPDISLATVYRNLSRFRNQGTIQCVATVRGIERFDANTNPHVHFICSHCDAVIDLHEIQVPQDLTANVEAVSGCHPDGCQLTFTGLCKSCHQMQEKIS